MSKATEMILLAVAVIFVVVAVGYGMNILNTGKSMGGDQLEGVTKMASQYDEPEKVIYDGLTVQGLEVISAINKFYKEATIEVLVCTKDGANLVYNTASGGSIFTDTLTGMPNSDAMGRVFGSTGSTITLATTSMTATVNGYNEDTAKSTKGFINSMGSFKGSIQRDSNESIRRITFVQK